MVAGAGGTYVEHDLDDGGTLVPVDRPRGLNKAGLIAGHDQHADPPPPRGHHPRRAER